MKVTELIATNADRYIKWKSSEHSMEQVVEKSLGWQTWFGLPIRIVQCPREQS